MFNLIGVAMYDVIVVGGGVAGLTAAYLLSKEGFKVSVIERVEESNVGSKVCGDAIGRHHFINLGLEEPKIGSEAEGVFKGVNVVSPDEENTISIYGEGYALHRKGFGVKLFKMASNSGAEILLEHSFVKPIVSGGWVRGVSIRSRSYVKDVYAKVIIDASGALACVRRSLPGDWWVSESVPEGDFNVCYREIWVGDIDVDYDFAWIFLNVNVASGGYWWLFPKKKGVYNIGLGVQKGRRFNPRIQFDKYVRRRFEGRVEKIVHGGGGMVPTRRPISCMVWNGFVVVGDAALTANPLHGGGIGPAMLSANIAAKTVIEALNRGEANMEALWSYHREYHKAYGAKQASLDILRMCLQVADNESLNYLFRLKLIEGEELNELGTVGEINQKVLSRIGKALKLAFRPSFLARIFKIKQYMDRAKELYLKYPGTPLEYFKWKNEEEKLFKDYKGWIGYRFS